MDIGFDDALLGFALGALGGGEDALLANDLSGTLEVAVGLVEGALGVHDAGPRLLPEFLDESGGDFGHWVGYS